MLAEDAVAVVVALEVAVDLSCCKKTVFPAPGSDLNRGLFFVDQDFQFIRGLIKINAFFITILRYNGNRLSGYYLLSHSL